MNAAWTAATEDMYKATQDNVGSQPGATGADTQQQTENTADSKVEDVPFEEVK